MKKFSPLLEQIQHKIDRAKVISFDVFDTLLLRPYCEPTDLFLHIEKIKNMPSFCACRIGAEFEARRRNPNREDITYDEIYEEIEEVFKPLKQIELDWEMMVLTQNPELKQVWDYVRSAGKKIVIVSDMYLPTDFIAKALSKNEFGNYDAIYVSSELGKTKATGTMYRHILDDMHIAPNDMLHIGDNEKSDYERPQEYKIPAVRYQQVKSQYLQQNKRVNLFKNELSWNLGVNIFVMLLAMRWQRKMLGILKTNYWDDIGYEYGGPIAYGYSRWVESQVKKNDIEHVLFVARDGYTLQKVFDTFDTAVKHSYVYAPRFLNLICRLDYVREDKTQTKAIIDYYADKNPKLKKAYEATAFREPIDYHIFISDNRELIMDMANKEFSAYKHYLSKIVQDSEKVCIVDTIAINFSSQRLLQNTLNKTVLGLYWGILRWCFKGFYENRAFIEDTEDGANIFTKKWDFIEFLLSAPEYPIKNIDIEGKPVYDSSPSEYEKIRKKLYPSVSRSAVSFAKDVKKMFGGHDIFLESRVLVKWVNYFCDNPTNIDIKEMVVLRHAPDSDHRLYLPLFSTRIPMSFALTHPKKAFKEIKSVAWRTKLQTLALCLKSPIKVKMRGIRQLHIMFLPKLQNRYFNWFLWFNDKCFYQISVGNEKDSSK